MRLLFVYNANSGWINGSIDIAHKILSPQTYSCDLCRLTHDTFSENKKWQQFRKTNKTAFDFYHLDEFEEKYGPKVIENYQFPVVLEATKENLLQVVLDAVQLKSLTKTEDLIEVLEKKIIENK